MLRMSYIQFMEGLQEELKNEVGMPFQIVCDLNIGIPPGDAEKQKKLEDFVNNKLKPIMNEIPNKVIMQ